jgi:uncharacterized membrane protein
MSQNPFEAPQVSAFEAPPVLEATGELDIGEAVSDAWGATSSNAGAAILGVIVASILMVVSGMTGIGLFLVVPVLAYGLTQLMLNVADGEGDVSDVFCGFNEYGHALGSMLLFIVLVYALQLPSLLLSGLGAYLDSPALSGLGSLVGMAIGFTLTFRLYFAPFYMVEQGLGAIDAVKAAWAATSGQMWMTVAFGLVASILGVAGLVACGFGMLFTIPMSYVMWAVGYRQLVGRPQA